MVYSWAFEEFELRTCVFFFFMVFRWSFSFVLLIYLCICMCCVCVCEYSSFHKIKPQKIRKVKTLLHNKRKEKINNLFQLKSIILKQQSNSLNIYRKIDLPLSSSMMCPIQNWDSHSTIIDSSERGKTLTFFGFTLCGCGCLTL